MTNQQANAVAAFTAKFNLANGGGFVFKVANVCGTLCVSADNIENRDIWQQSTVMFASIGPRGGISSFKVDRIG